MNLYIKYALICLALLFFFTFITSSQEIWEDDPRIGGVIREGRERIKIAVPRFQIETRSSDYRNLGRTLREVLINDLKNSGIFTLLPEERYGWIDHFVKDRPNYEGWISIESESLVTGKLYKSGDRMVFEGRIYDTESKSMRYGRRYRAYETQVRDVAHTFANEILRQFTGRKGFFSTMIVFVSDRTGYKELYIMDYDGAGLTRITNLRSTVLFPTISPSKNRIVFTSFHTGMPMLFEVSNMPDSKLKAIKNTMNGDITPAISPDGERLAFSGNKIGNSEIYVMDFGSGSLERLTYNYGIDLAPAWSPNGKNLVFTSDRTGMPNLYLTDSDGLETNRLTYELNYCDRADWSPDGDRIVFTGRMRGFFNIFVKDLRTNDLYQLTINSGNNEDPSWSPDGRKIVFSSNRTGLYQLYIMNSDGSDQKQITFKGNNTDPRWSK